MALIPKLQGQPVNYELYAEYTPEKIEVLDGKLCTDGEEPEKLLMLLLYNMGLEQTISLLPDASKEDLRSLLTEGRR